ncbi:uncharacterized protein LOC111563135 [Amphiprion ocellaris]|uniref:Coiled-coil domain-containing protein 106 n=1 Tax=Amphiprion ocellaris TaxID=80972 RepID=A0A3Q1ALJ2_AMPOC|nr:uncharacterized protein LOC111563135 [Amphiprion ocellaris]
MSSLVQTTSDGLCKLVRWAHSHGTICSLLPGLQRITCGSYGNVLTPGSHGGGVTVAVWGCSAGHAYHWPLSDQETFVGGRSSGKVAMRTSRDISSSEAASEGEEFSIWLLDIAACDSSATDEDGDYEPRPSRKRGGAPGGGATGKKIKLEAASAEHHETLDNVASMGLAETGAINLSIGRPTPNTLSSCLHSQHGQHLGCKRSEVEVEVMGGGSCTTGTIDQAEGRSSTTEKTAAELGHIELEKLRVLLFAERSRNQQMMEMISSLKQEKQLLQNELTKKAQLICDFLQDKLRPEKRWPRCSNQMEPGSSHKTSSEDVAGFDSPPLFDSFEEMELRPLEHHLKTKRSRDGENPRVRMKNVVGVIARYMAALQEFSRSVSMKVAFDRVGVDRNTISRTAAIAELSLAAPEVFHSLEPWDEKEETLAHYAHHCRQAMDDDIKAKIKMMKAKGELLPIVSK